ncbi:response regulator transcription factor [Corynebacterium dentalis]|uniref:response regulator transcription factor n=1 Tax=Corynebacterium dentalis TaxID=2014528 RepID=UPI00289B778E|nr:response regulator transcription factor [Corynebacterium dentalis]
MTEQIRVLIADDQHLVRGALAALLSTERDIDVVAQVGSGDLVLEAATEHRVDVAILDIEMPGLTGIEAAAELKRHAPQVRSLIVTTFGRPGYVRRALQEGASGFIVKDTPPAQLAEAIRRVASGLRVVDPTLAEDSLFTPANPLTEREIELCQVARHGGSIREIATELHISSGTVRNHMSSLIRKTGTGNRHAAVRAAEDNGWL